MDSITDVVKVLPFSISGVRMKAGMTSSVGEIHQRVIPQRRRWSRNGNLKKDLFDERRSEHTQNTRSQSCVSSTTS